MNLMFRKNFREGAKSSSSGVKLTSKVNRSQGKRSRDMGYGNLDKDADVHYRTHLFFAPNRGYNSNNCEGLCTFWTPHSILCPLVSFDDDSYFTYSPTFSSTWLLLLLSLSLSLFLSFSLSLFFALSLFFPLLLWPILYTQLFLHRQ